jgi:pyruvate,water dikinase
MAQPAAGQVIPLPDDFPVTWEPPEDERRFWFWDQMHHPHAVTPLTASLDGVAFAEGIGKACEALHMPMGRSIMRAYNSYIYFTQVPRNESPDEAAQRDERMMAEMMSRAPRVLQDWENIYLPEVMALNARLRDYPYSAATPRDLADLMQEAVANRIRQWELHFLAVFPAMGSAMQFATLYEETFGPAPDNEHYRMLQGFPNKSVEAGQALYDMAQELKSVPAVAATITETAAERLLPELEQSAAGKQAASRLRGYLDDYGWRSDQFELADPSWREDPRPMVYNLRAYLSDEATDPRIEQEKAVRERERLVGEMLARVDGDAAKRNPLQMMVTIAQQYLPVQENHNFYIDQMNTVLMRLPVLEIGRRLTAEGALEGPDDAFMLTVNEAQDAVLKPDRSLAKRAKERKEAVGYWSRIVPPQFIGTQPMEEFRDDIADRFWGLTHEPSTDPKVITGKGASRGQVTAPAKVVRNLSEADKLEPGDILVCEMTMPPWTPLFSTASAVVADSGGVLSHCAIVAREYGIPCVVGTVNGTRRIKDGQILTVDGAKGIVRIER